MLNLELEGKVAMVTGASRGIGRAIALALAQEGADIVFNFSKAEDLADFVEKNERSRK